MGGEKESNPELCEVPRWQMIKATLDNLPYPVFVDRAAETSGLIIDVRTSKEFDTGNIPKSINIDYLSPNLADTLESLDPDRSYFIYCRTGRRSLRVCVILRNLGFTKVYNLENGIVNESLT